MRKTEGVKLRFTPYANDDKENPYATFSFDDELTVALALDIFHFLGERLL